MEKLLVKKNELAGIAEKIAGDTNLYAPVKDEDNVLFTLLKGVKVALEGYKNTKDAPKGFLFPRSETLMKYTRGAKGMELADVVNESGQTVLFGVRPCDARSFALLEMLFDQPNYQDPYFIEKKKNTTVVALACARPPYSTCFCTSVGGSPSSTDGADVMLTDLGDSYLVEFLTDKGGRLAKYFGSTKADAAADAKKAEVDAAAAKAITKTIPAKEIKKFLDANFEHPFWETLHKKCLACGTCTFLCPTCHCFDIQDEVKAADGKRLRNWDSCMFPLFTKETSGHNPRPSQKERWRQRVMHKFRYYVDNFNNIACVGCGRCVMYCPVNMDIRKIVEDISKL